MKFFSMKLTSIALISFFFYLLKLFDFENGSVIYCILLLLQQTEIQKIRSESEKMEMRLTDYKKFNESLKCDLAKVLKNKLFYSSLYLVNNFKKILPLCLTFIIKILQIINIF